MPQQISPGGSQKEPGTKEQAYYEHINPLMQQIDLQALAHDIPFVCIFQVDDGQYILSHFTPRGSAEELHGLVKWVKEH